MILPEGTPGSLRILTGDWIEQLRTLPDQSVHCCVTSPPYWGLRDYGVPGQLGLEKTPEEYVAKIVAGFREVRRVLRDDGTIWVNLGDSYTASNRGSGGHSEKQDSNKGSWTPANARGFTCEGLKPKDLVGIPWRVAFALQADGWYLRSDIIWHKPNPMPESVTDRPTKSHEYIFMLSKQERYFYDAEAIKEPASPSMLAQMEEGYNGLGLKDYESNGVQNPSSVKSRIIANARAKWANMDKNSSGKRIIDNVRNARANGSDHDSPFGVTRNKRTVWTVTTRCYSESHFATFPPDLIKPCILAGCPVGGTVLDPFFGSGTTGQVALELGRKCIGIELNPKYVELAEHRCNVTPGLAL